MKAAFEEFRLFEAGTLEFLDEEVRAGSANFGGREYQHFQLLHCTLRF